MAVSRRAKTWEISESEDSDHESTPASSRHEGGQKETGGRRGGQEDKPTNPTSGVSSSPPRPEVRKRRSKEESQAERSKAKERKEEKERRRAARAEEKEERRQEQQRRREAADSLKSLRPENCLKNSTVCIEPALLQHDGSDTLSDASATLEWRFTVESQHLSGSITWTRESPQQGEDGRVRVEEEEQMVSVLTLSDFLDVAISVKDMVEGEETGNVLCPLLERLNRTASKVVTMSVTGLESDQRTKKSRDCFPERSSQTKSGMRNQEMEEVLVYSQLYRNISVVFVEGWQDVTDHVCAVTRALAKRPFKLSTERSESPFCVDGRWASGVRVERDGSGLRDVWSRQIQQSNRVSPAVAAAVAQTFQSPQLSSQAYQNLGSEAEKKAMSADLSVKTEEKERRIGPDISSRVYRCLTAQNPQSVSD